MFKKALFSSALLVSGSLFCLTNEQMLIERVKKGQKEEVARLLKLNVYVNTIDDESFSPLHHAAGINHVDIVRMLLEAGALVNEKTKCGGTALGCNLECLAGEGFLEFDPDTIEAMQQGSLEVIRLLLEYGADINEEGLVASLVAFTDKNPERFELVKDLIKRGADVNGQAEGECTALHEAAHQGDKELVIFLLQAGANKLIKSSYNRYPCDLAGGENKEEIQKLLALE